MVFSSPFSRAEHRHGGWKKACGLSKSAARRREATHHRPVWRRAGYTGHGRFLLLRLRV